MTTGDYLVSKSPLSSGTALAHLLAMQTGTGQGTVFASMFAVRCDAPRLTLVQRAKREAGEVTERAPRQIDETGDKNTVVLTRQAAVSVLTETDELFIRQGSADAVVVRDLGHERLTVQQSDVFDV